jgi:hypothetical protein
MVTTPQAGIVRFRPDETVRSQPRAQAGRAVRTLPQPWVAKGSPLAGHFRNRVPTGRSWGHHVVATVDVVRGPRAAPPLAPARGGLPRGSVRAVAARLKVMSHFFVATVE